MRKVIVDQIEALAELNRIVARHGKGLDVATATTRASQREDELMVAASNVRNESVSRPAPAPAPAPRPRDADQRVELAAARPRRAGACPAPHGTTAGQPGSWR